MLFVTHTFLSAIPNIYDIIIIIELVVSVDHGLVHVVILLEETVDLYGSVYGYVIARCVQSLRI